MKKIHLIFGIALLSLASCGNEGAFSEDEKKQQDSADNISHEDKFKNLENMGGNDSGAQMQSTNKNPVKPEDLPGNQVPEYVPPQKNPPPPGTAPVEPVPQQPKR